jgi:hypothetical protein
VIFEVVIVISINITVFWDVMPCILVDGYHCCSWTYCLNLEVRRWRRQVPPNWHPSIKLLIHGVTSKKNHNLVAVNLLIHFHTLWLYLINIKLMCFLYRFYILPQNIHLCIDPFPHISFHLVMFHSLWRH